MKKSWQISVAAFGVVGLLSACDMHARAYSDPGQVVRSLESADIHCRDLATAVRAPSSSSHRSLVRESGTCSVSGQRVVIATFSSTSDRDNWVAVAGALDPVAIGPNWAVTSRSAAVVADIAEALKATRPLPQG